MILVIIISYRTHLLYWHDRGSYLLFSFSLFIHFILRTLFRFWRLNFQHIFRLINTLAWDIFRILSHLQTDGSNWTMQYNTACCACYIHRNDSQESRWLFIGNWCTRTLTHTHTHQRTHAQSYKVFVLPRHPVLANICHHITCTERKYSNDSVCKCWLKVALYLYRKEHDNTGPNQIIRTQIEQCVNYSQFKY